MCAVVLDGGVNVMLEIDGAAVALDISDQGFLHYDAVGYGHSRTHSLK